MSAYPHPLPEAAPDDPPLPPSRSPSLTQMGSSDVVTLPITVTTYPALKARIERGAGEIAAASAEVAAALAIERKLRDTQKGLEDTLGVLVDEATDRLIEAIKQEDTPAAVAALDEGANPNRLKWTAAGENDSEEIAMMSALMWAAAKDNADMATLLLDRGADVNQGRTHDGWTALTWAAAAGRVAIVRLLLDRSADPNQAGTNQAGTYTALMFAAMQGHLEVARLLLECSADPNQAPTTGHTPLMFAAMRGHFEVARLLLECSADPNQAEVRTHSTHGCRPNGSLRDGPAAAGTVGRPQGRDQGFVGWLGDRRP